jgi:hypothetical protein
MRKLDRDKKRGLTATTFCNYSQLYLELDLTCNNVSSHL